MKTGEASALSSAKVSCAGHHGSFFKQMEGPCDVYGQKMRHKMVVSHWCCGEGESHMVIQPLCRVWGGGENCSFHASERWCEKFKKLMSLHNLK